MAHGLPSLIIQFDSQAPHGEKSEPTLERFPLILIFELWHTHVHNHIHANILIHSHTHTHKYNVIKTQTRKCKVETDLIFRTFTP